MGFCVQLYTMCMPGAQKGQKRMWDPVGTGVTESCETSCWCKEMNLSFCKSSKRS